MPREQSILHIGSGREVNRKKAGEVPSMQTNAVDPSGLDPARIAEALSLRD